MLAVLIPACIAVLPGCSQGGQPAGQQGREATSVSATSETAGMPDDESQEGQSGEKTMVTKIAITANGTTMTATLADNSSAAALAELLEEGPLTVDMSDYAGMEKVGPIGQSLPANDEQITTGAGDIILYQGSALVIYYAPNSWSFTRLGRIDDEFVGSLRDTLGAGDVQVTLELA